ncbi:MAG: LptF/LptG family permease, partial [Candidatus Omnitrophica bacterium]|nr:LptF/LptG family permease [Candidatus Omnitrophota bacterium]
YILKNFIFPFLYCLSLFLFLYVIFDLFEHLNDIFRHKVHIELLATYYLSLLPIIFIQVTPVAILLATLYTIGDLNRNHELTAMNASGISMWRLVSPLLLTGIFFSVATFLVSEKIIPSAYLTYQHIKKEYLEATVNPDGSPSGKIKKNVALIGAENRLCYAGGLDAKNSALFDLTILEQDTQNGVKNKITARKALWENDRWTGYNVIWQHYEKGKITGEPVISTETELPLKEGPGEFLASELQNEFMSFSHLKETLKKFSVTSNNAIARNITVGLHTKLSFPLINLIAVLLAAPFAMSTKRGGVWRGVGISIAIGFSYYVVSSISVACGKAGFLPPALSAWLPLFVFGGTGFYLLSCRR